MKTDALSANSSDLPWSLTDLERDRNGIWAPRHSQRHSVSYPDEGNDRSFLIEDTSFWFAHRNRMLVELVRRFPPAGPILDVGGGNGYVTRGLAEAEFPCTLLEPGYQGCLNARKRGIPSVVCSTIESAGFGDESIAAFGLFDVLEHIEDDIGFLQNLHRLASPGARLYLTVPALPLLWSKEDEIGGHFRRYTQKSLRRVFDRAGWGWQYGGYCFTYAILPIFLRRVLGGDKKESEAKEAAELDHGVSDKPLANRMIQAANRFDHWVYFSAGGRLAGSSILAVVDIK